MLTSRSLIVVAVLAGCAGWSTAAARSAAPAPDFGREVLPILQRSCFECHGPAKQAGGLRLDSRESLLKARRGVVVPGQPESSALLHRVLLPKGKPGAMPAIGDPLTREQVGVLRGWIQAGAKWPAQVRTATHWAYVAPKRPALPKVSDPGWCRNPIDYFVLARLDRERLKPSPEADRATLLRRVSLDLTGLPPTPAEAEAFLADRSLDAYEKAVDRLLASPEFGVRWARPWLDLARYADSHGFQRDDLRDIWAYRDWVVEAFNADVPFDRFTVDQLAGDLVAGTEGSALTAAERQRKLIATGFHRNAPTNVEAGSEPEETRTNQVLDRVNTTASVWLGSTLECAQCHDHKYDPFTQRDYYRLLAFFNNTAIEADRADPKVPGSIKFLGPSLALDDPKYDGERERLQAQVRQLDAQLAARRTELSKDDRWEKQLAAHSAQGVQEHVLEVVDFDSSAGSPHRTLEDGSLLLVDDPPDRDTYTILAKAPVRGITGFKLEALTDPSLPGMGPGRGDAVRPNFVLNTFALARTSSDASAGLPVRLANARADFSQGNFPVPGAIDDDPKTAWAINPRFHQPHWATFETAAPLNLAQGELLRFTLVQNYGGGRTIGRLRLSALTGKPGSDTLPGPVAAALAVPHANRTAAQTNVLRDHQLSLDPAASRLKDERAKIDSELRGLRPANTLVMQELPQPRKTAIFVRGNYATPGEGVTPGTPGVLSEPSSAPLRTRLDLAHWLVSPKNPLTARVTVNRWWSEIFGQGIVSTVEDFGIKGELPTHPELLDWLASSFAAGAGGQGPGAGVASTDNNPPGGHRTPQSKLGNRTSEIALGWSTKALLRLIVTSATYRQSSRVTPQLLARDDQNRLYARGPRFRMDAEMIRDNALTAAGLLSRGKGGPPVRPYQPDGLWTKIGGDRVEYVVSPGEQRYRRGLYVVWKRGAPYPSFMNFDASARLACTVKRSRSNTPLQALTLLNDPVYVEAAQALARRIVSESPAADVEPRILYAFRCCVTRTPSAGEVKVLRRLYDAQLAAYKSDPPAAAEALGGAAPPSGLTAEELAAWQVVAVALLNLDETITKN